MTLLLTISEYLAVSLGLHMSLCEEALSRSLRYLTLCGLVAVCKNGNNI